MPTPILLETAATTRSAATDLLDREIANPDTQWSLGTFGASLNSRAIRTRR